MATPTLVTRKRVCYKYFNSQGQDCPYADRCPFSHCMEDYSQLHHKKLCNNKGCKNLCGLESKQCKECHIKMIHEKRAASPCQYFFSPIINNTRTICRFGDFCKYSHKEADYISRYGVSWSNEFALSLMSKNTKQQQEETKNDKEVEMSLLPDELSPVDAIVDGYVGKQQEETQSSPTIIIASSSTSVLCLTKDCTNQILQQGRKFCALHHKCARKNCPHKPLQYKYKYCVGCNEAINGNHNKTKNQQQPFFSQQRQPLLQTPEYLCNLTWKNKQS